MGKFNPSVAAGQASVLDTASVDLPVAPSPQPSASPDAGEGRGTVLGQLKTAAPAPEAAPLVDEGITMGLEAEQAMRERERIPTLSERKTQEPAITSLPLHPTEKAEVDFSTNQDANGGMMSRALQMKNKFDAGQLELKGIQKGSGAVRTMMQNTNALTETGIDPAFLPVMSVVTENTIATMAAGSQETIDGQLVDKPVQRDKEGNALIKKAQQNQMLGQEINREWQRIKNAQEGRPTDSYTDLAPEEATLLGDMAKEIYYEANKGPEGSQIIRRETQKIPGSDKEETFFVVTKYGQDRFKEGEAERARLFPKQNVRPVKQPMPGGKIQGESRTLVRGHSGQKIKQVPADASVINEATRNFNQVANVVDRQRNKILLAMALPALSGENDMFANNFDIGTNKLEEFEGQRAKYDAKVAKAAEKGKRLAIPEYNVDANMQGMKQKLANALFGIAQERNGANYLTYYVQDVTGRIAPQQSLFDPTTSKPVRFVTRNAVPAMVRRKGDRISRNLEQMYAMMLVSDSQVENPLKPGSKLAADALLPARRVEALKNARPRLYRWGKRLEQLVNESMTDAELDAVNDAIEAGIPLTDPKFPKVRGLGLDPEADADLIEAIQKKGEDGGLFIDGLIDYTKYEDAKLNGFKNGFASYFNAMIDGKTNGLASAGIQLGLKNVATQTGVLRSQGDMLLDGNADLRDALKADLLSNLDKNGFEGDAPAQLWDVAREIFSIRDLNKATTMTFGYGKELDSFKTDIDNYLRTAMAKDGGDNDVNRAMQSLANEEFSHDNVVQALLNAYVPSLANIMHDRAIEVRGMEKGTAYLHALAGEILSIPSYTGFMLHLGGLTPDGSETAVATKYTLEEGGKSRQATSREYGLTPTAAAGKTRVDEYGVESVEYGGAAAGQSVTSPIQSLDAATVAMTAAGDSWKKLRAASGGNPYLHSVYDAFKMDAMGFDVVLEETNKNWLKATMDWSLLDQFHATLAPLNEKIANKKDIRPEEEALFQQILEINVVRGDAKLSNLANMMWKMTPNPTEDSVNDAVLRIAKKMRDAGHRRDQPATIQTYKALFYALRDELNLANRFRKMSAEAEAGKKEIREEIARSGNKVYQYYAH